MPENDGHPHGAMYSILPAQPRSKAADSGYPRASSSLDSMRMLQDQCRAVLVLQALCCVGGPLSLSPATCLPWWPGTWRKSEDVFRDHVWP